MPPSGVFLTWYSSHMTHVHAPVLRGNADIAEKARDIHPLQFTGRLLLTTITGIFVALGWIAGAAWFSVVFSVLWTASRVSWLGQCTRYGFRKGARVKVVPKELRGAGSLRVVD